MSGSGTRVTAGTSISPEPDALGVTELPETPKSPETPRSPEAPGVAEAPENSPEAPDASWGMDVGMRGSSSSCECQRVVLRGVLGGGELGWTINQSRTVQVGQEVRRTVITVKTVEHSETQNDVRKVSSQHLTTFKREEVKWSFW